MLFLFITMHLVRSQRRPVSSSKYGTSFYMINSRFIQYDKTIREMKDLPFPKKKKYIVQDPWGLPGSTSPKEPCLPVQEI